MKVRIYITLFCLSFSFIGKTQTTLFDSVYFNSSANLNEEVEYIYDVCLLGNNYYNVILGDNVFLGQDKSFILKTDSLGNLLKRFDFVNNVDCDYNNTAITVINQNKLMVVGTQPCFSTPDTARLFIVLFNKDLDSLDYKCHNFPQPKGQINKLLYDGGKYVYGTGFCDVDASTYGELMVVKLDTLGNLIWTNRYGLSTKNETGITLQLIGNDTLFIGGYNNESMTADGIALLLDTAGNQKWLRYVDYQSKWNIFAGCYQHSDGGYICPGDVSYTSTVTPTGYQNASSVTKLNSSGIAVWTKIYDLGPWDDSYGYCFMGLDTTIIAVGGNNNVPQFHEAGLAIKYTMEGDTMWTRTYDKSYNLNGYIDHFYKGIATNDGGYLFAGQTTNGIIPGKTDAWLLKTDSIGCHPNYPCWPATHYNYTGLKNNAYSSFNINVFPNPASNYVCVKFKNINQNNACTLKLYNIAGQLVKQKTFNNVNPIALLNIEDVEQGMYVLEVETLYSKERTKIIKE